MAAPGPGPGTARVLEIGCASGDNLIPMAAHLPDAQFVGIELSARQARDGQQRIEPLGLNNCQIMQAVLTDFSAGSGLFDDIIAHGVYSWESKAVAGKMLALCRALLSGNGIAYISYNTLPGWRQRAMLRDMLLHAGPEASRRPSNTCCFCKLHCVAKTVVHAGLLMQQIERIQQAHPNYLFHEYLEPHNRPVLFSALRARITGVWAH